MVIVVVIVVDVFVAATGAKTSHNQTEGTSCDRRNDTGGVAGGG